MTKLCYILLYLTVPTKSCFTHTLGNLSLGVLAWKRGPQSLWNECRFIWTWTTGMQGNQNVVKKKGGNMGLVFKVHLALWNPCLMERGMLEEGQMILQRAVPPQSIGSNAIMLRSKAKTIWPIKLVCFPCVRMCVLWYKWYKWGYRQWDFLLITSSKSLWKASWLYMLT